MNYCEIVERRIEGEINVNTTGDLSLPQLGHGLKSLVVDAMIAITISLCLKNC